MSGAAGSHDEAISLVSDDETDQVAGTIGLNAEPEPEPDPSPESWGEYMENKYMGQGLRDQRNKLNANIIRAMCLLIAPSMTLQGYFILLFCSETVDKDCPKARTGGASFAASRVLNISPDEQVEWMKDAEALFAREVPITWLPVLRPETFMTWLVAARRVHLRHVPADAAGDLLLARQMCEEEHQLLGYCPTFSEARPNAAAMELLRWLLLDKPRPQMAFCFLQLKPIFELGGDRLDEMMPASWASKWETRADKVTSHRFWWVGQGGVMTPSDDALVRERSAADSYTRAARQRLGCGHATMSTRARCFGPLGNFESMCSACRREPEAVLRDHCRGLIETGTATASCRLRQLCSVCRGVDGRKLRVGEERKREIYHVSRYQPCPGRCNRKTEACQKGWRLRNGDKEAQRTWCAGRADLPPLPKGKKRVRQEDSDDE
jgi:hypothetical protein